MLARFHRFATVAAAAIVLGACAGRGRAGAACGPVPQQVVDKAGMPVFNGCETDIPVGEPKPPPMTNWAPTQVGKIGCFSVVVELVVDETGLALPATRRIRASYDKNLEAAVLADIYSTPFVAARKNGRPVAQLVHIRRSAKIKYWARSGNGGYYPVFDEYVAC